MKEIILTNMCMIINEKGEVLVQNRVKKDWPGINFPGGHIENNESIIESCIREIKEETNLDIKNLINCGYYEWNIENARHLCILFKTYDYSGELKSSNEGNVFFVNPKDFSNYKQAIDFIELYNQMIKY